MNVHPHQRGAALGVSLFILIILTLLGLTAMRGSALSMRLAANEEARLNANESAQALIDAQLLSATVVANNFPLTNTLNATIACYPEGLVLGQAPLHAPFTCALPGKTPPTSHEGKFESSSYLEIFREAGPGGQPFVTGNSVPTGGNSYRVLYARFRITGGYDRSTEGMGAAEVTQGVHIAVPDTALQGVSLQ